MATIDVGVCGPALMWPQGPTLHTGHVFFGPCEFHVLPVFPLFLYLSVTPPTPHPKITWAWAYQSGARRLPGRPPCPVDLLPLRTWRP